MLMLEIVKRIPKGKVSTYKAVAEAINSKAYRVIGKALSQNTNKDIPCHRVIRSNGEVGGFFGSMNNEKKIKLLEGEGIKITNGKIDLNEFGINL